MNIYYIFKKISHHAGHSGYDQLVKHVPSKALSPAIKRIIAKALTIVPEKYLRKYTCVGGWYNAQSLAGEIQIALNMAFRKGIYIYLYGEDDFHWGGFLRFRSSGRIVVTYHQPPVVFERMIGDKFFLSTADALVVCGLNQVEYLERFTGRKNVFYVPHGVDTDYFTPGTDKPENRRFNTISVGWWLRDVDMIRSIIRRANEEGLGAEFNIVTFPQYLDLYKDLQNVNLFTGLTDEELKKKYQQADALLLPLQDCTANNSVLEAMACGLPVMTTDVGGIRGYVDETCGFFSKPGDHDTLYQALKELLNGPEKRRLMGRAARKKALMFTWQSVARQMMEVYERI